MYLDDTDKRLNRERMVTTIANENKYLRTIALFDELLRVTRGDSQVLLHIVMVECHFFIKIKWGLP